MNKEVRNSDEQQVPVGNGVKGGVISYLIDPQRYNPSGAAVTMCRRIIEAFIIIIHHVSIRR